jgi:hypothetical protein
MHPQASRWFHARFDIWEKAELLLTTASIFTDDPTTATQIST